MRKILFLLLFSAASHICFAQYNTVTFTPSTFTGDDAVTMTIDLTGTPLEGETNVYIWAFANSGANNPQYPTKDGVTNTEWGNSPDIAKLTNIGGNVWSFTFTGSQLFGLAPGQLKYFQFLVKTKTGNKQTSDSPQFPFAAVAYVPSVYRLFPSRVDQNDAITIYFYQNLATSLTETRMTPQSVTVKFYNGSTQVGSDLTLAFRTSDNGLFTAMPFIPAVAVAIPSGTTLTSFTYVVNGSSFDVDGNPINVSGAVNTRVFDILN